MSRLLNRLRTGGRGLMVAALALAALGSGVAVVAPAASAAPLTASAAPNPQACWGQATAVFAATGELGQHASSEPTPRLGLANLARALFDQGVIPAPRCKRSGPSSLRSWGCPSTPACSRSILFHQEPRSRSLRTGSVTAPGGLIRSQRERGAPGSRPW